MSNASNTIPTIFDAFLAILMSRINLDGRCDDAAVCKDIATYINLLHPTTSYSRDLYDFIAEYGEDADENYIGRDEFGEKQYVCYNKETNWHERVRKELECLGYFKRMNDWYAEQRKVA